MSRSPVEALADRDQCWPPFSRSDTGTLMDPSHSDRRPGHSLHWSITQEQNCTSYCLNSTTIKFPASDLMYRYFSLSTLPPWLLYTWEHWELCRRTQFGNICLTRPTMTPSLKWSHCHAMVPPLCHII